MTKDNESMPVFNDSPLQPTEPQGFSFDQMVRCDSCLRANPPTRVNCIYCGTALPWTETSAALQKPVLRRLEPWEQGYNNIFLPNQSNVPGDDALRKAADLLRLKVEEVDKIFRWRKPLPLARAATEDEAALLARKLRDFRVETFTVSDIELDADSNLRRARSLEFTDSEVVVCDVAGTQASRIPWRDLVLLVTARLVVRQLETRERKSNRAENEILDASETTTDESVVDLYVGKPDGGWRIAANNFDFSCLAQRKILLAAENFSTLLEVFRERAPQAEVDDSYNALRQTLEAVWPSERQTEARGWRRHRPGKYSTGDVTIISNQSQFTRYSHLLHHLKIHPQ